MKHQFVLSVWGKRHLEIFSKIVLPSLMTTGNLLGFSRYDSEFDIYTTPESKDMLVAMPIISALSGFMKVRITILGGSDDRTDEHKYARMNDAHTLAIIRSAEIDSALYFLAPDAVFGDGTLAFSRLLLESGKRVVMLAGARAAASAFIAELTQRFNARETFGLPISPRDLASLLIRYPHDGFQYTVWGNSPFTIWPSHILFPVADEGYILRGFHHHPIAVYPENRRILAADTIDGQWLAETVPKMDDWHLIADTDDAFVVDVGTAPGHHAPAKDRVDLEAFIAGWMHEHSDQGHRWMVSQSVLVHDGRRSPKWLEVDAYVERTFKRINDIYRQGAATLGGCHTGEGAIEFEIPVRS